MSFKINDNKLLKKYNQTQKKVKNLLNIKLDSEAVYGDNDKYVKTKIKIVNNMSRSKYIFVKQQDDQYYFQLYIRTYTPK